MKKTIDLAKWNPVESYPSVLEDGVETAILKAINISNKKETAFETHMAGCKSAGIEVIGTYHYSYATSITKAVASAQAWINAVNGRCKMFWLDWEDASLPKNESAIPIIRTYADIITSAGYDFGIYCGLSWYNTYLKKYVNKLPYPFWIARYPSNSILDDNINPNDAYKPSIASTLYGWQYTSKGRVNGIKGNVDLSVMYGLEKDKTATVVPIDYNPYSEPTEIIKQGMRGEGVKWVQWYLYRFGLLLGADGLPDESKVDGIFGNQTLVALKQAQKILALVEDGLCGKITRATFKKIC